MIDRIRPVSAVPPCRCGQSELAVSKAKGKFRRLLDQKLRKLKRGK